ncbi:MAG: amidohydrolase family protein, partial [Dehalococcoidia bacterium]
MPRVIQKDDKDQWWADDVYLEDVGHYGETDIYNPGMKNRVAKMAQTGFIEDIATGNYHPTNAELRLKDQDLDGVDAEVIYGLFAVATKIKDQEQVAAIHRVYNDWLADFTRQNPERLVGLACIPNHDPQAAAAEVRRAAGLGLRGCEFGVSTAVRPIYYPEWDVLWEASADCNMPLSFHTTGLLPREPEKGDMEKYGPTYLGITLTVFQLTGAEFLASIILSGACQRFPNFKFILGECGVTWIPYILDRMDHEDEGDPNLEM